MAYDVLADTYSCDFCGAEIPWERTDAIHGDMWGCEKCGKSFCSKCFRDRHGGRAYGEMMQGNDEICCPYCWERVNGKGSARWASEIEEFPIAVTKIRFGEEWP